MVLQRFGGMASERELNHSAYPINWRGTKNDREENPPSLTTKLQLCGLGKVSYADTFAVQRMVSYLLNVLFDGFGITVAHVHIVLESLELLQVYIDLCAKHVILARLLH